MTITVTPTVELSNVPPRVRLDITTSAGETSTTVTRLDPDGNTVTVRTADGGPLAISGTAALLYDYLMPYGQGVAYSSIESPATVSAQVTVAETRVWLNHPSLPALSMPVDFRVGSFDEETWDVQQGVFWPMGRSTPVIQTDGARKAPAGSFIVAIETSTDLALLRNVTMDASPLLLNVPPSVDIGVDTCYIAVGPIRNKRISSVGGDEGRAVELPYQVVDAPAGGTQSQRNYVDVLADNATYADLMTKYDSYLALLAGP